MKYLFISMCRFRLLVVSAMVLTFWGAEAEAQSPHPSDTNQDWEVGDFELLDYIDQWAARQVEDFDLLDTIDFWAAGEYYWDESSQKHVAGHAISDQVAINLIFDEIEALFATSNPDQAAIDNFAPFVAVQLLENGGTKTQIFNTWMANEASPISHSFPTGLQLNATISSVMNVGATRYQKGYWVDVNLDSSYLTYTWRTSVVFDVSGWLWYGNRQWIETNLKFSAFRWAFVDGSIETNTGLDIGFLRDAYYYASSLGVQSGILTGPGLPPAGMALDRYLPEDGFDFVINQEFYYYLDDAEIDAIPDNAEYTISLYAEDPSVVLLANTPLVSYVVSVPKPPLKKSQLSDDLFPTIVMPTSHTLSASNIGGVLGVEWTNTENSDVKILGMGWDDQNQWNITVKFLLPGATISMIDTSNASLPPSFALLMLLGDDIYGRGVNSYWIFE